MTLLRVRAGEYAAYRRSENAIFLGGDLFEEFPCETILHELTHAICEEEGEGEQWAQRIGLSEHGFERFVWQRAQELFSYEFNQAHIERCLRTYRRCFGNACWGATGMMNGCHRDCCGNCC